MYVPLIPSRALIRGLTISAGVLLVALIAGLSVAIAAPVAAAVLTGLIAATALDYAISRRAWREASPVMTRGLPAAFAIAVKRPVHLAIAIEGSGQWTCELYDHADPSLLTEGLPITLRLAAGTRTETAYHAIPTRRGEVTFAPADIRVRSRWGLCELLERIGATEVRRVYPDFAQVARYAWLAGDRRLQEIGIKTYHLRGQGTDFKQLSEYRAGDPVRQIDWRATLRLGKPIVREYQDERDQYVMLLVDCGRRLRADDRTGSLG